MDTQNSRYLKGDTFSKLSLLVSMLVFRGVNKELNPQPWWSFRELACSPIGNFGCSSGEKPCRIHPEALHPLPTLSSHTDSHIVRIGHFRTPKIPNHFRTAPPTPGRFFMVLKD